MGYYDKRRSSFSSNKKNSSSQRSFSKPLFEKKDFLTGGSSFASSRREDREFSNKRIDRFERKTDSGSDRSFKAKSSFGHSSNTERSPGARRFSSGSRSSEAGGSSFGERSSDRGHSSFRERSGGGRPSFGGRDRNSGRSFNRGGGNRGRGNRFKPSSIDVNHYVAEVKEAKAQAPEFIPKGITFSSFGFDKALLENLQAKGYETATLIQEKTIPLIINGKDLLGISKTGSGKTGAFLMPMVNKILKDPYQRLLVLAPTRELAIQIDKEAFSLIKNTPIKLVRIIGGENMFKQKQLLARRPNIIIATPGRLIDVADKNMVDLAIFNNIVVDEVDRMLDMGFIRDVKKLTEMLATHSQKLFFSATMSREVEKTVNELCPNYESIKLEANKSADSVKQDIVEFNHKDEKVDLLHSILINKDLSKAIIFTERKVDAERLERDLRERGFKVASLHGDKTQGKRKAVINGYRENRFNILVATDVAARGIDISDISHVINFDEPNTLDDYIHRIGRTGRNGKTGKALTFVDSKRTRRSR